MCVIFSFVHHKLLAMFQKKQTSFSCLVKNRPLRSACCSPLPFSGCMNGGISRLLSPQGTSPNSFSVNFRPLPNSDEPFSPTEPTMKDLSSFSLCTSDIFFFFDCSLSADGMQRMQIHALFFLRPLP